ncbi:MAG: cytosine permease [Gammaproteobacteria bacterium]
MTTTLIQLFIGAMIAFVAGIKLALLAGLIITIIGALLGWGTGHIAYKSGLASSVMSRLYGFGIKGSLVTSSIFGFMIIGFIAAENVLLYKGFLFYLKAEDTLTHRVIAYSGLTAAWIFLTTYGFAAVTRVASLMLVSFLCVLIYMMFTIIASSGQSWFDVLNFGTQVPGHVLEQLGVTTETSKLIFCVNILSGSMGALALVDADLGRYARSSADIGVAALLGNLAQDILMILIGGVIMFAGLPALVEYYVSVEGFSVAEASQVAFENPDRVAAAFIVFGGVLGTILMVAAQSKAQVLNTYSSSLSLANFFDVVFSWRPGRFVFVVLANLLSLILLYGEILTWFNSFLVILGVLTTCFVGIMLADYFLVRPRLGHQDTNNYGADVINWAGVSSLLLGFVLAHFVLNSFIPIEIFTALAVSFIVYPLLRMFVLKPSYHDARI